MQSLFGIYIVMIGFNIFPLIFTYYVYEDQSISNNAIDGDIDNPVDTYQKSSVTSAFKKKYYSGTISAKYRKPVSDDLMDSRFQVKPLPRLHITIEAPRNNAEADCSRTNPTADNYITNTQSANQPTPIQVRGFYSEDKGPRKVLRKTEEAKHGPVIAYQRVKPSDSNTFVIRKLPLRNYFVSGQDKVISANHEGFQVSENAKIVKFNADQIHFNGIVAKRVQNYYHRPDYKNHRVTPNVDSTNNWNAYTQSVNNAINANNNMKILAAEKDVRKQQVERFQAKVPEHCSYSTSVMPIQSDKSSEKYKRNVRFDNKRLFYGPTLDIFNLKDDRNNVRQPRDDVKKPDGPYTLFEAPEERMQKQYAPINKLEDIKSANDKQKFKGFYNEVGLHKGKLRVKNYSNYRKL